MPERILIPLDGSKVAELVLPYIDRFLSSLAPGRKVEVILFHVLSPTYYVVAGEASAPVSYTEAETEQIRNKTMDYLDKAGEGLRGSGLVKRRRRLLKPLMKPILTWLRWQHMGAQVLLVGPLAVLLTEC